jgi:peptidoglycan hydrolase-like protein with peptidoglycan-binding domain
MRAKRTPPRTARRIGVAGGSVAVLGVAGVSVLVLTQGPAHPAASVAATTPSATAEVTRGDLVSRTEVDGTLGYAESYAVLAQNDGRLTWLPKEGTVIRRGRRVYQVNGHSVPLFYGKTPLWRPLTRGMSDGEDVRELERNLKALGYGDGMTVDDSFTAVTAAAVKDWQEDLGVSETGTVQIGDVVIQPGALRIASLEATLGGPAQGKVLTATGTSRQVTVDLPVTEQELAKIGDKVRVELPGGTTTSGKVTAIGTTASSSDDSDAPPGQGTDTATVPVYVTLLHPKAAGRLVGAPVTVGLTGDEHKNVLSVPVNALLATGNGQYAVLVTDGTTSRRVPVELGIFADGQVEVSGDGLDAGMRVEVPSS